MRQLKAKYNSPRARKYIDEDDHSVLSSEEEDEAIRNEGSHIALAKAFFGEHDEGWVDRDMDKARFIKFEEATQTVYIKVSSTQAGFPRAWCHFSLAQLNSFIAAEEGVDQVFPPESSLRGATARYFRLNKETDEIEDQYEGEVANARFAAYSAEGENVAILLSQEKKEGEEGGEEEDLFHVIILLPLAQIEWFVSNYPKHRAVLYVPLDDDEDDD